MTVIIVIVALLLVMAAGIIAIEVVKRQAPPLVEDTEPVVYSSVDTSNKIVGIVDPETGQVTISEDKGD